METAGRLQVSLKVGGVGVESGKMLHLWVPGKQAIEESARSQAQVVHRADTKPESMLESMREWEIDISGVPH